MIERALVFCVILASIGCDEARTRGRGTPRTSTSDGGVSDRGSIEDAASIDRDAANVEDAFVFEDAAGGRDATFRDATIFDATIRDASGERDATAPDAQVGPVSGLAGWWRFEETSGAVLDSSGNNHHGAAVGGVTRGISGRQGMAIQFDGSGSGWVVVPASPGLDFISAGTIELWVRLDSGGGVGSTVSRGTGNNDDNVLMNSTCGNMQTIFSRSTSGGGTTNVTSDCNRIPFGVWTHIGVVNDGRTLQLYVNGVADRSAGGGFIGPMFTDLWFGLREQHIFPLHGALDEIKWWTVARTQAEVCGDAGGSWTGTTCVL